MSWEFDFRLSQILRSTILILDALTIQPALIQLRTQTRFIKDSLDLFDSGFVGIYMEENGSVDEIAHSLIDDYKLISSRHSQTQKSMT
jgi:hypothetical protein